MKLSRSPKCKPWWKDEELISTRKEWLGLHIQDLDVQNCDMAHAWLNHQDMVFSNCTQLDKLDHGKKREDPTMLIDCTKVLDPIPHARSVSPDLRVARLPLMHMQIGNVNFYGKSVVEYFIYNFFFRDRESPGTFLEVGAVDGLDDANTLFYEESLGWHGVLVEPTTCSIAPDGALFKNRNMHGQNNTIVHGAMCPTMSTFKAQQWSVEGVTLCHSSEAVCQPLLNHVPLSEYSRYDLMVIDVEGAELSVMKSVDFTKLKVAVLLIEWRPQDLFKRRQYLDQFGYICFMVEGRKTEGMLQWGGDELCWNPKLMRIPSNLL